MKKIFTFIGAMFLLFIANVFPAQGNAVDTTYVYNETFTGLSALPTTWTTLANNKSAYGRSGTVAVASDMLTV